MSTEKTEKKLLSFRGKPLIRCGNTIYYGNTNDRFIVEMQIKSTSDIKKMKVAEKVLVLLVDSAMPKDKNKKIIKMSEKLGLYNALETGIAWLNSAKEFQIQG